MTHYFEANVTFSFWGSRSILPIFTLLPFIFWPSSGFKWRVVRNKHFDSCWLYLTLYPYRLRHFICPCENCTKPKYLWTVYNKLMLCPNISQSLASSYYCNWVCILNSFFIRAMYVHGEDFLSLKEVFICFCFVSLNVFFNGMGNLCHFCLI